jgi:hypothetical protein
MHILQALSCCSAPDFCSNTNLHGVWTGPGAHETCMGSRMAWYFRHCVVAYIHPEIQGR